jgi:hypothetical protein
MYAIERPKWIAWLLHKSMRLEICLGLSQFIVCTGVLFLRVHNFWLRNLIMTLIITWPGLLYYPLVFYRHLRGQPLPMDQEPLRPYEIDCYLLVFVFGVSVGLVSGYGCFMMRFMNDIRVRQFCRWYYLRNRVLVGRL